MERPVAGWKWATPQTFVHHGEHVDIATEPAVIGSINNWQTLVHLDRCRFGSHRCGDTTARSPADISLTRKF